MDREGGISRRIILGDQFLGKEDGSGEDTSQSRVAIYVYKIVDVLLDMKAKKISELNVQFIMIVY